MIHVFALHLLAQIPDPASNPDSFLALLVSAFTTKQYFLLGCLTVLGASWLAGKGLQGWIPWLGTEKGQLLVHFLAALAATLGVTAAAHLPITLSVVIAAISVAVGSVGGLEAISRLFFGAQQVANAQAAGAQAAAKVDGKDAAVSVLGQK